MGSPHRPLDTRSGLVLDTHELGRRAGARKHLSTTAPAPEDLGVSMIAVPAGSPVELELDLEAVVEGVLVTGTAQVALQGECVRCLTPVADRLEVELVELFVHAGSEATEDEASRLVGDQLDLEPVLRDAVVLDLPFTPLCRVDCAGLCPECGADLNAAPDHTHDSGPDPRWSALTALAASDPAPNGSSVSTSENGYSRS